MMIAKTNAPEATLNEWNLFRLLKQRRNAERFSFVDEVLDTEYGYLSMESSVFVSSPVRFSFSKAAKQVAAFAGRVIFRTYLLIWFSLYFAVSTLGRLLR